MKFWKLKTGALTMQMEALICADTAADARKIAADDDETFAECWERADIEEVTPKTGMILLTSAWEDW